MIISAVKFASKTLLKDKNAVSSFVRKFDKDIGEELTHRLTGTRYFKPAGDATGKIKAALPTEIRPDGSYRSITPEQYEKLKSMKIRREYLKSDGKHVFYTDDATKTTFYANKNPDGEIKAQRYTRGSCGSESIPTTLWNKIVSLFE